MFTISLGASPVLAFDAPRGRVFCAGDGTVHGGGEARREKTDVCENDDEFEERVTQVTAEKEQVKRVRFTVEEEPEETRAQITISGRGRTSPIQGADQRKKLDFISLEICSDGRGKGDRGKGAPGGKGGVGSKELLQCMRMTRDEVEDETKYEENREQKWQEVMKIAMMMR